MNMITRVNINNIEAVKGFCKACNNLDCEVTVTSGRYSVDGKSIMGIFSLDLSKPIDLCIHADESNIAPILDALKPYICE